MHSATSRAYALAIMASHLLTVASARAMWIPDGFDSAVGHGLHHKRGVKTCSADSTLNQCPTDFPPNFCCSSGLTCLSIHTGNSSITSAICCPTGQSCSIINPVQCNEALQDANKFPGSQLHSIPPQQLAICGTGCCPAGYSCKGGQCTAQHPLSTGKGSSSSPDSSRTSTGTSASTAAPTAADSHSIHGTGSGDDFSGESFIAGFLPGIAIGLIIAVLVVHLCMRRKRNKSDTYVEKNRDTLTDLSTLRPNMHGRSISEPTVDPAFVTRTDFLRSTPPRTAGSEEIVNNTYDVAASGAKTTESRTPRIKAMFSRSPFMNQTPTTPPLTQPPVPAHLKRGTLNFTISPIRGLKKQKSMHSLRRHVRDSARYGTDRRTESTETIQVLMPSDEPYTPDQRTIPEGGSTLASAKYQPPPSATTWAGSISPVAPLRPQARTPYASSSRYPSELPQLSIPAPPPPLPGGTNAGVSFLESPYTPTKSQSKAAGGGLTVPSNLADERRETTFSTLMEKAGLRKSDLVMGTKKRVDGKFGW